MRISELTFDQCVRPGELCFSIHYDCSDCLRNCRDQEDLDRARAELMAKYGDVEVILNTDNLAAPWYDRVVILDEKFQQDYKARMEREAEWMKKNPGCE